jgi:hypothetical protein
MGFGKRCMSNAANAHRLAAVPAFIVRQLKSITKVQYCSFVQHLVVSRYSGKPLLCAFAYLG